MTTLLLAAALLQQPLPDFPREWVVKDLVQPEFTTGAPGFFWEAAAPIGDPDGDGLPTLMLDGRSWAPGQVLDRTTRFVDGLLFDGAREWTRPLLPLGASFGTRNGATSALLATPSGVQLAVAHVGIAGRIEFLDPQGGALLASALGPGQPDSLQPAGDLDGDGWEDLFAWFVPGDVAAYSGRTGAPLWSRTVVAATNLAQPVQALPGAPPDLDGDGHADLLVLGVRAQYPLVTHWQLVALSGVDGAQLWQAGGTQGDNDLPYLAQGLDFTGDGVPDAALVSGDVLAAVDGASGALLWQRTRAIFDPYLTPQRVDDHFIHAPQLTRSPADPQRVEFVIPHFELTNVGPWESRYLFFHVDAADGSVVHHDLLPATLDPWMPDTLVAETGWPYFQPLGDVDRDGLADYALVYGLAIESTSGWVGAVGGYSALVFLGPRTVAPPPALSLSRPVLVRVGLPGAAGRVCRLAVAAAFTRDGGARVGAWRSYLTDDPLYAWFQGPGLTGATLDARGQAVLSVSLPPNPALAGRTLALRVQVPGALGDLHTQSTLQVVATGP